MDNFKFHPILNPTTVDSLHPTPSPGRRQWHGDDAGGQYTGELTDMHATRKNDLVYHGSAGDVVLPLTTAVSVHAAAAATGRRVRVYISQAVLFIPLKRVNTNVQFRHISMSPVQLRETSLWPRRENIRFIWALMYVQLRQWCTILNCSHQSTVSTLMFNLDTLQCHRSNYMKHLHDHPTALLVMAAQRKHSFYLSTKVCARYKCLYYYNDAQF